MIRLSSFDGNDFIGVHSAANEGLAIVPPNLTEALVRDIMEALDVEVLTTTIAGTIVVCTLLAMNSNGAVVADSTTDEEIAAIEASLPVLRVEERFNAMGNNILLNDNVAIINPDMSTATIQGIEDFLGIEVVPMSVAGHSTVGSACVATNKGVICHPRATEEEMDRLRQIFGLDVKVGTLNYGVPLVGACLVSNSKGAVVGSHSTPIELGRLEEGLSLY